MIKGAVQRAVVRARERHSDKATAERVRDGLLGTEVAERHDPDRRAPVSCGLQFRGQVCHIEVDRRRLRVAQVCACDTTDMVNCAMYTEREEYYIVGTY